ncbi:hypothetical protein OV090_42075 [Nannocystis sp. RBIL2]|uniref:hypothetical protein n=1 Tax=Nannocystis sp. RBIL2 TaxID=2996788 RepID=UPI002270F29C|nr:hypothetical protein [Nannocystis sp. RBIL2]MCY1071406.1 hypothetical protein [Nannocystis sp. RBIL2]
MAPRVLEVYSRDQLGQMIAYLETEEGAEDHLLALLLVYSGPRIGEAVGLH